MGDKIPVLQFEPKRDAREVIRGMSIDELALRRNEIAGQYVVFPETENAEGALQTFVVIGGDHLEISHIEEEHLIPLDDFDGSIIG
jgi:hypothetical protein